MKNSRIVLSFVVLVGLTSCASTGTTSVHTTDSKGVFERHVKTTWEWEED